MCSTALTPWNGMLPCAIRPRVCDLEPVDAAMADADAIDAERLGDDGEVGAVGAEPLLLGQPRDAGEAAALFVDRAADLDAAVRARRRRAGSLPRRRPPPRSRPSCRTTPRPQIRPVAHLAAERIDGPAGAGGDDVEVAVQVDERAQRSSAPGADDVEARVRAGVLGPPFRRVVLDVEAARRERVADEARARPRTDRPAGSPSACGSGPT